MASIGSVTVPVRFTRDPRFWKVVGLVVALAVVTVVTVTIVHRVRVKRARAEAVAAHRLVEGLEAELAAATATVARAQASDSAARASLVAVRDSVERARVTARAERSRASGAILELRGHVEAAAGDSASVVALVDSLTVEHGNEVAAVLADNAALEVKVAALEFNLASRNALIDAQAVALFTARATITELVAESAKWEAAFELADNPPFSLKLTRGSKWVALGAAVAVLVTR